MNIGRLLFLLAGLPAVVLAKPVDERVDAAMDGRVEVSNLFGDVIVSGWDMGTVQVTGDISEDAERLEVRREGDRVIVDVIYPENWEGRGSPNDDTDLMISVPRGSSLVVDTVSADVTVSGVEGEQNLTTVSGDVITQTFAAEVRVESVSGDLQLTGLAAPTRTSASAVSGDVDLSQISGEMSVQAVSGDVNVASRLIERAEVQSVSGDVTLRGGLAENARVRANSTSGDVQLFLSGDAAADYSLSSFSGEIDNCFGPPRDRGTRGQPGSTLRFSEGSSGARVQVSTMSGDIELCR